MLNLIVSVVLLFNPQIVPVAYVEVSKAVCSVQDKKLVEDFSCVPLSFK